MLIRDLAWLTTLAELGHVTDSAAALGVSQPTLSRALTRIEAELGARLFERVPGGVVVNPAGELVVEAARELLDRYARLTEELAGRLDPDAGVVRLAFLDSIATYLVPRLLRAFHAEAPRVRVVLRQEPAHEIARDLQTGAADLAVSSYRLDGEHGWFPVQHERLVLIVPPTHRLAGRRRVALTEVAGDELITTPPGYGHRDLVQSLLTEAEVSMAISFESADLATIEGLVAAGLGVAVVPEQLAGQSGTIGLTLATAAARRTIGLVWRTDRPLAPAAARFRRFVEAYAAAS